MVIIRSEKERRKIYSYEDQDGGGGPRKNYEIVVMDRIGLRGGNV